MQPLKLDGVRVKTKMLFALIVVSIIAQLARMVTFAITITRRIYHAMVVEKTDRATLEPIIGQFVEDGSTIFTDELNAYNHLNELGFNHNVVNHGSLQFVCNGSIYTNNIEGFWSHFRRMIIGCYHDVSDEHLQSYIDEACFRWNTRKMTESERFKDMFKTSIRLVKPNREFILCQKVA